MLIDKLKKIKEVKQMYVSKDHGFIKLETTNGTLAHIEGEEYRRHINTPLVPTITNGSSVKLTDDWFISDEELISVIKKAKPLHRETVETLNLKLYDSFDSWLKASWDKSYVKVK